MILVDTSVWIEHLRRGHPTLADMLGESQVVVHPLVVGELACGRLAQRREILALLSELPQADVADHHEVLTFIERHRLMGIGIGWIDAHLLASAALSRLPLWTLDGRLKRVATGLGLHLGPESLDA